MLKEKVNEEGKEPKVRKVMVVVMMAMESVSLSKESERADEWEARERKYVPGYEEEVIEINKKGKV